MALRPGDNKKALRELADQVRKDDGVPKETVRRRGHRHYAHGSEGTTESGRTTGKQDPTRSDDHTR